MNRIRTLQLAGNKNKVQYATKQTYTTGALLATVRRTSVFNVNEDGESSGSVPITLTPA